MSVAADVFVFAVVSSILWLLVCKYIPWAMRMFSLYELHGIRDEVYRAGNSYPAIRDTPFYRNAEFIACYSIYAAREGSWDEALGICEGLADGNSEDSDKKDVPIGEREMAVYTTQEGQVALKRLKASTDKVGAAMSFYVVGAHPLGALIFLLTMPLAVVAFVVMVAIEVRRAPAETSVASTPIVVPTVNVKASRKDGVLAGFAAMKGAPALFADFARA